ncbi:hypothetical protein NAT51_19120 [Flavobacterium amniphilum]|uniref:hypothetical protein n=1 Tax=Flavobacterium amniphilum TaxID=1834035 RepID=UPI00202A3775|nr:hypothetical protein [Flavobacterium amniphilum]MCL9807642.1 hypothetical protein [Flavobacterium amniphilum]
MKSKFIILILILVFNLSYSQIYNCSVHENQLKIYDFALTNLNTIKKHTKSDLIIVSIDFNDKSSLLENIRYYQYPKDYTEGEIDEKYSITVWNELDLFIRKSFEFCPRSNFEDEHSEYTRIRFGLPLVKENIAEAIGNVTKNLSEIKQLQISNEINENTNFTLTVNNLKINREKPIKLAHPIVGKLNIYQSDIVKISDNYFLIFKVLKTSELNKNLPVFYFEYKLFYVHQGKTSLVSKGAHQTILNKHVEIIEQESIIDVANEMENEKKMIQETDISFEVKFE